MDGNYSECVYLRKAPPIVLKRFKDISTQIFKSGINPILFNRELFNPRLFKCPDHGYFRTFQPWATTPEVLVTVVEKSAVEKSWVKKFIFKKSGAEKFGVEKFMVLGWTVWGWKSPGLNVLRPLKKVRTFC